MKEDEVYRTLTGYASEPGRPPRDEEPLPSETLLERARDPQFLGEIRSAEGYAVEEGECGDAMEVYLSVQDRTIRQARFDTLGCGYTVACGDVAMELAENRTLSEALCIRAEQVDAALGGLPESHRHCAELAVKALRGAVRSAIEMSREPWKKPYG